MSSLLAGLNDLFSQPFVFLSTPTIPMAANSRVFIVKKHQLTASGVWMYMQSKFTEFMGCTNSECSCMDTPVPVLECLGELVP